MGWDPAKTGRDPFLILSHAGRPARRRRDADRPRLPHRPLGGRPARARPPRELDRLGGLPFAAYVSDPCDGRTQGTTGMMDSLPYRNDAAIVLRRLIRSLPTRRGVLGVATCDKGLPAMMMALAAFGELPGVVVPGGVTLPPRDGEDAGKVQTIGARFAHGLVIARGGGRLGCRACASPGGGCQFLGTAATSQVVAEALRADPAARRAGAVGPADLAGHGPALGAGRARAVARGPHARRHPHRTPRRERDDRRTPRSAARRTCCSTSPPSPTPPGCARPTVDDWRRGQPGRAAAGRRAARTGPRNHPTVRVFLAGGVPEVMLHLRRLGLLERRRPHGGGPDVGRRPRLVGGQRAPAPPARTPARAGRRRPRRRDHARPSAPARRA